MPRFANGDPWLPHGCGPDSSDDQIIAALCGAWGTPDWPLDIAAEILRLSGAGPWLLDPGTRPGCGAERRVLANGGACCYGHTPESDGLAVPWLERVKASPGYLAQQATWGALLKHRPAPSVWNNPSWHTPAPWVARAVEAADAGLWVQVLVPATTGRWWTQLWSGAAYVTCLRKVCFDLCPGLGGCAVNAPTHQVSLVTLAPPGVRDLPRIPDFAREGEPAVTTLYGPRWAASRGPSETERRDARQLSALERAAR